MRTALDAPLEALDESDQDFVEKVRQYGWAFTSVPADEQGPGFRFTTGLWHSTGHAELILFSMKRDIVRDVFADLFRAAKAGNRLPTSESTDRAFANLPAYAFPVATRFYPEYLGRSRWFYGGDDFPCLQIVWPDRESRFPWQPGFNPEFADDQPDLSERGWKQEVSG
ncbi:DUF4262 domain-containing protein [Sphingomonas sp. HT-1]|uniref:DUF4262 domain-containing protein n=1 Tax=unclassified Sphingomonas TaxID=196159 RepID=UPI0003026FEE|nr:MULTISPECIES: DUF4262 domain-containing protein [unclassified Sphingomonas]KTF69989.1 hypothetical protein ATB93_06880 [Sphingomonas sp. WG]